MVGVGILNNILTTSAVSSTNFGSITSSLQAALLVQYLLVMYYMGEFFKYGRIIQVHVDYIDSLYVLFFRFFSTIIMVGVVGIVILGGEF